MSMKCKKCGCDALIKTDDWYKCPQCGAVIFDTDVTVNNLTSPTKEMEKMEKTNTADAGAVAEKDETPQPVKAETADTPPDDGALSKKKKRKSRKKQQTEDGGKPAKSKTRETVEFFIPIVIAVVVAILLKNFVFANAVVPTGSMLNTIQEGDRIIASRLAYVNEDPERYDIIIFRYPDDENEYYVKRIVGLPGETVQVVEGVVYVTKTDGETIMLDDSFVTTEEPEGNFGPYEVPEDAYFVMGDNRNNSWDSRYWNNKFVYRDKIIGEVKFRYYPSISKIE